jgi:hypothetical protein
MTEKGQKGQQKFYCEKCDILCFSKWKYDRHILTAKHKMVTNGLQNGDKKVGEQNFECWCGRVYNYRQGLHRHQKTCLPQKGWDTEECENAIICQPMSETKLLTNLVLDVVKQNQEFQKQMFEFIKDNCGTNHSHNTTNSHNKTFNLQFFLNETCKDAMNIMDFVDSLQLQLSDLESVGKLGYVDGISNIIVNNLKKLDMHKRPVHCSDPKREIMYVKNEDKWEKESEDKSMLRKAIKYVAHKNIKLIPEFRIKYPDCGTSTSKKSDEYNKIIIESMGGSGNNQDEKDEKIIRRIAKEVTINKNYE